MVTDRVGDFIIRLQNAAMIGKAEVSVPHSAHILAIAKKLKSLGFLATVSVSEDNNNVKKNVKKVINVMLVCDARGVAKLRGVKRISKPGRRLYSPYTTTHKVMGGTGVRILSTPSGIISDAEARKNHVGGENLFEIW